MNEKDDGESGMDIWGILEGGGRDNQREKWDE